MHQMISEFPTLDCYSIHKLQRTGDRKLVDWCSDMIGVSNGSGPSLWMQVRVQTEPNRYQMDSPGFHDAWTVNLGTVR